MPERKIAVITGSRADYGLLKQTIDRIGKHEALELEIYATGMHLSPAFGLTVTDIEEDGFIVTEQVDINLVDDSALNISKSLAYGVSGFAGILDRNKPDILLVLGDRFEIMAAVIAALIARIPVAHIHGGEVTEGSFDDEIRHAITKMSHIHFVAADEYRKRVIQLGEDPENVFNVGAPGLDQINNTSLLDRDEWENQTGFSMSPTNFLVTYHPATLDPAASRHAVEELCKALDMFPDAGVIITSPNTDPGSMYIAEALEKYTEENRHRVRMFSNLGSRRYLSAIRLANVVIGNSSSGIIEAPFLKTPTVNIGSRQMGRIRAKSVIDCDETKESIVNAIQTALSDKFQAGLSSMQPVYGQGNTSEEIVGILATISLENLVKKRFYDVAGIE
jgi:UDP-N-acetylglucosamine 2-epimerase (non-hydrolysing)/GDP/UDP-N,N'-diacetylbacillosamine 2-epimerase (hydrolysing)